MKTTEEIIASGFIGFKTIKELTKDCSCLPDCGGVYLILFPDNNQIEFIERGTGGFFKGKDPNVKIEALRNKWITESNIVYIGKATSLRKRLNQYFRFGQGKNVGHYGGRYIWQLKNSSSLIVCWKPLKSEDPREVEASLIRQFVSKYGNRPYANLCD